MVSLRLECCGTCRAGLSGSTAFSVGCSKRIAKHYGHLSGCSSWFPGPSLFGTAHWLPSSINARSSFPNHHAILINFSHRFPEPCARLLWGHVKVGRGCPSTKRFTGRTGSGLKARTVLCPWDLRVRSVSNRADHNLFGEYAALPRCRLGLMTRGIGHSESLIITASRNIVPREQAS